MHIQTYELLHDMFEHYFMNLLKNKYWIKKHDKNQTEFRTTLSNYATGKA